jgi:hypothetical protein
MPPHTLSLPAAYEFAAEKGLGTAATEIRNMEIEWDSTYTSTVRRGYIVDLFEANGVFDEFKRRLWSDGNTPWGATKRRLFIRVKERFAAFMAGQNPSPDESEEMSATPSESSLEFAVEAHLRDFLAKNLETIEPGLRLYADGKTSGVEYAIDAGRVDILAVDHNGKFVVIELKLSRGRNRTLGQILYYMSWVDDKLGNAPCRGLIIANEITDELKLAVRRAPGVSLAGYKMSFAVEPAVRDEPPHSSMTLSG